MNPRFFTKTFTKFFLGFLCIIGLAFAVMLVASGVAPQPVDNVAVPR
ncbi:MAG: hypothetical protein AAB919_03900 [Patescibacteria group bacterium]